MDLSALFSMWLLGITNWYLMSMVVFAIFKYVGASLYMKWNRELIPRIFEYSVNSVKNCIISLSIILFVAVVRMALESYTYMMKIYLFTLLDVMGKRLHRSE